MILPPRSPAASFTVTTHLVFPEHANALGNAFGGTIMAWSDTCGAIAAMRHSGGLAVTAAVDEVDFERPIVVGDMVVVEARVNAVFRTSLEVEVVVWGESPGTGVRWRCVEARFTFVAVGVDGKPRAVPPLVMETDDETTRARDAADRREQRLTRRRRRD